MHFNQEGFLLNRWLGNFSLLFNTNFLIIKRLLLILKNKYTFSSDSEFIYSAFLDKDFS